MSPEILEILNDDARKKSDLFSIGVTIYFLYFGVLPYSNLNEKTINLNFQIEDRHLEDLLKKLLRENILTSSSIKNAKSSNKFYSRTGQNNFNGTNTLNNEPKKVLSFSLLKYKPRRLINIKKINIPLPSLGKVTFDYSRTFVSENSEIKI